MRIDPEGNVRLQQDKCHSQQKHVTGTCQRRKTAECGRLGIETHSAREHHNKIALLNAHMPKQNANSNLTPHLGENTEINKSANPKSENTSEKGWDGWGLDEVFSKLQRKHT